MNIRVKLFGPQARFVGDDQVHVQVMGDTVTIAQLRQALMQTQPALASSLGESRLAVNHAFVREDRVIGRDDEVALIGMVSGG